MGGKAPDGGELSEAARAARQALHEEIERVRVGVEEMLDHQENAPDVRRELETLRLETRDYVKKKVRKSEKRVRRSIRELDARTDQLERRVDQVEADRSAAEVRIHNDTEAMLDGLLQEVRTIADRLSAAPAHPAPPISGAAPDAPSAAPSPPAPSGQGPGPAQGRIGRIGRPFGPPGRKRS